MHESLGIADRKFYQIITELWTLSEDRNSVLLNIIFRGGYHACLQLFYYFSDKVENLLTVWQLEGFFMNADTTGYEKLSPMMAARAPNLRWKIETAKALLKLLIHLHDRDIAQEKLTINDVYIKPSSFVSNVCIAHTRFVCYNFYPFQSS